MPNAKTGAESAISRIRTLYEQMETTNFEMPVEDEKWRYVYVPASDEDRIVEFFRNGYEPADGHHGNDAKRVVLRIDKERHHKRYLEACATLKAAVNDQSGPADTFKGEALNRAEAGRPRTETELKAILPDSDPEENDS